MRSRVTCHCSSFLKIFCFFHRSIPDFRSGTGQRDRRTDGQTHNGHQCIMCHPKGAQRNNVMGWYCRNFGLSWHTDLMFFMTLNQNSKHVQVIQSDYTHYTYTELYENTSKIQIHYQLYTSSAYSSKDNVNMQQSFKRLKLFRALLDLE